MRTGFAKICINPPYDAPIVGYYESRRVKGILDDLFVRAVAFDDGESRAAVIALDLCILAQKYYEAFKDAIVAATGMNRDAIFINCSHTHTGPMIGPDFASELKGLPEYEAYLGLQDDAAHSYRGSPDGRVNIQYGPGGFSYIYLIYGMYNCLNFVTEAEGTAAAVLIRGCEPVYNRDAVSRRRFGTDYAATTSYQRKNFMNGPGKLCKGLSIDRSFNNLPCGSSALYTTSEIPELGLSARAADLPIQTGKRIGIDYAEEAIDFPWRFWLE